MKTFMVNIYDATDPLMIEADEYLMEDKFTLFTAATETGPWTRAVVRTSSVIAILDVTVG